MKLRPVTLVRHSLFILFMAVSSFALAQQRDVVHLKNGSIVKGTVLEIVPNGSLKIETTDGSMFVFELTEVEKIVKEPVEGKRIIKRHGRDIVMGEENAPVFSPSQGYFLMAKFGPYLRPLEEDATDLSISFVNGLHINEFVSLGFGVDLTSMTYNTENVSTVTILPVYFDTRFYIPKKRVQPMFHFQIGYGTLLDRSGNATSSNIDLIPEEGGIFMAGGAGMKVFVNQRIAFLAEGGLAFQNFKGPVSWDIESGYRSETTTSFRINIGVCFSFGKKPQ